MYRKEEALCVHIYQGKQNGSLCQCEQLYNEVCNCLGKIEQTDLNICCERGGKR